MGDEQWNFLFKYYPEYSAPPNHFNLFVSLFGQAKQNEDLYNKPQNSGQ
jgi:hypothetical protein